MVDNYNSKSALEHNIKTKGENSYYYAHGKKYEPDQNNQPIGKIFEGEGLIYGGEPVLLNKKESVVQVIKPSNLITKYIIYDDESFTKIKIELPENIKDQVTIDSINAKFTECSLDLKVTVTNFDPFTLLIKKLFAGILPKESYAKLIKGKIIIGLKKIKEDEVWEKLTGVHKAKSEDD